MFDVIGEVTFNGTDDKYNGHEYDRVYDTYFDILIGAQFHFKDCHGRRRFHYVKNLNAAVLERLARMQDDENEKLAEANLAVPEIFEKIKNVNISSFELDRKLTEIGNVIEQIKNDYKALEDNEDFSNYFEDVYEINERLEATKSFYNKYTTLLNAAIKKIPSNIIASFHHMKVKAYFDGKDMFDEEIKDFKL